MKIKEVAEQCAVNVQTLRFYERRGLLRDPRDGVGGYREYEQGDVDRVQFIRQAQALGFTLGEIEELLSLRAGADSAACVKARAQEKIVSVRAKITALRRLERALLQLVAACPGRGSAESCPILLGFAGVVARPRTRKSPRGADRRSRRRSR